MKCFYPTLASITVLAVLVAASPVRADVTLKPKFLTSVRASKVDARVLEISLERSTRSAVWVRPKFTILSDRSGQLATETGSEFEAKDGRNAFTKVTNGIFSKLVRELARIPGEEFVPRDELNPGDEFIPSDEFGLVSVQTLDPRAQVRFDSSKAGGAVVFEFDDARPVRGEAVYKHKVVVFVRTPIIMD